MSCPKYFNTRLKYKFFLKRYNYNMAPINSMGSVFISTLYPKPQLWWARNLIMNRSEFFFRKIESFLKLLEIFLPVHPFIQNESDFKRYARILQVSNKRPLKFLRKILKFSLQYLASLYYATYGRLSNSKVLNLES